MHCGKFAQSKIINLGFTVLELERLNDEFQSHMVVDYSWFYEYTLNPKKGRRRLLGNFVMELLLDTVEPAYNEHSSVAAKKVHSKEVFIYKRF